MRQSGSSGFLRRFAVRGVVWRHYLDFALLNVPHYLQPLLISAWTVFFYFVAAPARRAVVQNLAVVLPGSSQIANHFRAIRVLQNFAWTIAEAANFKLTKAEYHYDITGTEHLEQLAAARGAIVLTAHMGSYDLGAALFARELGREIQMVRAPEPDQLSGRHLEESVQQTGAGAVKVAYNTGAMLSFDLLNSLRRGDIISIQGDRVIPGVAEADGEMFGRRVRVPAGPFTLALVAQAPIYPLFIARCGYRSYHVIVAPPILLTRTAASREHDIAAGVAEWCRVLEQVVAQHWDQWFAFVPIFVAHGEQ
jgi:phosphatidylinositol dimannoside acyltransferase